ncbi:response regulator transcription factor [Geminocystis sp. GBBB08]|uniref:response regulator transcription factor n=1 Tax=Geminocystis sp. GBBB08 TaxID=2604140 RepID=UPI0027E28EAA|nr:response regulator transcription factor [Geminocystis sp. GBBB08]MBL1210780.1 response regulator transcription factor [Geminocystis sp. GBBB08]
MKIILVEDDQRLGKLIQDYLIPESEKVDLVNTGIDLKEKLDQENYDILILDVMLPKKNGIDICRELRSSGVNIAILFITALNNQIDKMKAFESGADDYLIKPFDFQELLARIKALTRRETKIKSLKFSTLEWHNLIMIPEEKKVKYEDNDLHLTPTEFKILEIFLTAPQKVYSTDNIIDKLWGIDTIPTYNTLRTHIKSLRKELTKVGLHKDFIETIYGVGYKLKPLEEKSSENMKIKSASLTDNQKNNQERNYQLPSQKEEKLQSLIEQMWLENQDSIYEDCQQLLDYMEGNNNLSIENAITITHNFAGFLGSIGYQNASNIAKKIENLFKDNRLNIQEQKIRLKIVNLINSLLQNLFPNGEPILQKKKTIFNKNNIKILVIDEDIKLANQLIMFIENPQISLSFCHSISSCKKFLHDQVYDLVILETKWQNNIIINDSIFNLLKVKNKNTKIIIYSKDDSLENRLSCSKYPINAFLSKTNSLETLWQNIENILKENQSDSIVNPLYNILIIDDDVKFTAVLKEKLKIYELPFNINILSKSETFLDEIKKIKPELILLDLEMPKLNGLDICKIIKKDPLLHSIPIIFLTSNFVPEIITQFVEAGADDFISKSKIDFELYPRILTHLNIDKS